MKDKVHGMVLAGLVAGLVALAWQRDTHTRAAPGEPTETRIDKKERTMTVSGTAKVRFSPDSARIFFGVESTAPTVKEARSQTNQRLAKVMDAIRDLKIDGIKMKTSDVRVDAVHEHRRENGVDRTVHVGYKVAVSFTVLAQHGDANQLGTNAGRILDTGLDNGANVVQRIAFFKEKWRQHQREAMTKAVEDALENARA
ncbi:MAG: SIMPL domain-containing protein, partial [Gemmataceae bacterium]